MQTEVGVFELYTKGSMLWHFEPMKLLFAPWFFKQDSDAGRFAFTITDQFAEFLKRYDLEHTFHGLMGSCLSVAQTVVIQLSLAAVTELRLISAINPRP